MPLAKVEAKLNNIDRIIDYGKRDVLQIVDRDTKEVLATVKLWKWNRLNPGQEGAPTIEIKLAQDTNTKDLLPKHLIAINGRIHDVPVRHGPISSTDINWILKVKPTNSFVVE